jgi:predicted aspartyl protease
MAANPLLAVLGMSAAILVAALALVPSAETRPPPPPPGQRTGDVLASAQIDAGNRCKISGYLNGVRLIFMVDTGAPRNVEMSSDLLPKFGMDASSLVFEEEWPGTRYGKIAKTTFEQLRIGRFVLNRPHVWIYDRWSYSFGNDTAPLLGMATLQSAGVRLEVGNGACWLLSS